MKTIVSIKCFEMLIDQPCGLKSIRVAHAPDPVSIIGSIKTLSHCLN